MLDSDQGLAPTDTPTFNGLKTTLNIGTAATGVTAVEYGDGWDHTTVLTVNTTLPSIAGGAALALGKLLYTLPAGAVVESLSYISLAITQTTGHINANTPDIGLGTTLASGANATLAAVGAATTNINTKTVATNCTGTATVNTDSLLTNVDAANDHTIYANVAASWAALGDPAATLTGTVVINWQFLN